METIGQPHSPAAFSRGKDPPVPLAQEAGWAHRAGIEAVEKIKID
jgi:hypothetical protein